MNLTSLLLILLSVSIAALAQISLKLGMSSPAVQQAMSASTPAMVQAMLSSPAVMGGLALYGLGAITWLFVLARVDVSQAYPFIGLAILMTLAFGYFLLSEPVSALRVAGVLLIVAGIGLVAQS